MLFKGVYLLIKVFWEVVIIFFRFCFLIGLIYVMFLIVLNLYFNKFMCFLFYCFFCEINWDDVNFEIFFIFNYVF